MNKEEFIKYCKELDYEITEEELKKIDIYYKLLIEWNNKFNLTSILKEEEVYLKHFYDSICLIKSKKISNEYIKLCDFGTGAGFPGLVLKILFNNIELVLIESNAKKCKFLEEAIKKLGLKNVVVINQRAEIYSKTNREVFDVVTCRAVSALKVILEIGIPLLKVKGCFLAMKGNPEEEIKDSKKIVKELDIILEKNIIYNLPIENSKRSIVIFKKIKETNKKYPRDYNKIIRKYS